jgi:pimeloyl-ACP methyl ester carboxylesterase
MTSEGIMADRSALGEKHELRVPNGTVVYRERGEGDPIVFVHGFLVDSTLWRKVVPLLCDQARCITPDWPLGSHRTPLDAGADLTPTGLALCQIVAAEHPDRVARLVLTDCDAFENFPPKAFRYLGWAAKVPGALSMLLQSMRLPGAARSPIAFGWLTKRRVPDDVLAGWMRPIFTDRDVRRDATKVLKGIKPAYTLDAAAKNASFDRPVLLAWAREDRFFPFAHAERLAALFPDARLVPIEDSRTFVSEDQPEALADAIRGFLAGTSTTATATAA